MKAISVLFLAFLFGFSMALQDCQSEVLSLVPEALRLVEDLSSGNPEQFKEDLLGSLPALEAAAKACGASIIGEQCEAQLRGLLPSAEAIIRDIAEEKIAQLEEDVRAAAPLAKAAIQACTGAEITEQCSGNLLALARPVTAVFEDVRSNDSASLEEDLLGLLPFSESFLSSCTGFSNKGDSCHSETNQLLQSLVAFIGHLASQDYSQLENDIASLVPQIEMAVFQCTGHDANPTCQRDLVALLPMAMGFVNGIQKGYYFDDLMFGDINGSVEMIKQAWGSCFTGNEMGLFGLQVLTIQCDDMLQNLVPMILKIYYDLKMNKTLDIPATIKLYRAPLATVMQICQ
jgi:hypothetical protein